MAPVLRLYLAVPGLLFLAFFRLTEGGKLLVVPQDGSHWLSMRPLVEELQRRGHEIVLVVPESNIMIETSHTYTVKTYHVPYTKEFLESKVRSMGHAVFSEKSILEKVVALYQRISNMTEMILSTCRHFLDNKELIQSLKESQFDALLIDPVFPCGQIVAEYLSIPSVFFMRAIPCSFNHEAAQCPSPASYVPRLFTTYTDRMVFFQRAKNMLMSFFDGLLCRAIYAPYGALASQFLQREVTALELFSGASLLLLRYDFLFEFPRPVMPNMVFIGGINCAKQMPLSQVGNI
ncbi:hypothetical protein NDU88_004600 [Pleurodeles waltl]|uniref:glucuronosyltransferase n=1 Tax=Pleurodeles waltl TaxID=8319 RepID=A0AAV7UGK3_PLEWA|nr:hypothetical protein NDU88_004600 [Pleurodeles waltl]